MEEYPYGMRQMSPSGSEEWETAYRRQKELWAEIAHPVPDLPPGSRVLELGCGNAGLFASLAAKGYDTIGLDFSRTAIKTAQTDSRTGANAGVVLGDARALPIRNSCCDAVIARHILGHMIHEDRQFSAQEIKRVLRPEGILVFMDFSREDFRCCRGTQIEEGTFLRGTGIATHYFSEDDVKSLFGELRCREISTEYWDIRIRGVRHPRAEIHAIFTR